MATEHLEMNGTAERESGEEVSHPHHRRQRNGELNMNHYANKKSAAESMLDVALLMANASQLKAVMEQGPSFTFYTPLIALISISLILQITVGILLIFIVKWNLNDESTHFKLNIMENIATALVFVIVVAAQLSHRSENLRAELQSSIGLKPVAVLRPKPMARSTLQQETNVYFTVEITA
ncbi:hypothetical protein UPYG_G00165100 [Umbra pygmaea]|uniref:Ninjurin 1 n=1 Tax=Umbra pygmaea TaxID=75934 RepID=A0ABD0WME1_UMBPY